MKDSRPSIFAMNDVECLEGVKFDIKDKEQNKVNLETNCGFWVERPDDGIELIEYQMDKKPSKVDTKVIFFHSDDIPF